MSTLPAVVQCPSSTWSRSARPERPTSRRQSARRVVFGTLCAGLAAAGLAVSIEAHDYEDQQDRAWRDYQQALLSPEDYERSWNEYLAARDQAGDRFATRNWLYALAALSGLGFVVSIWF